MKNKRLFLFFLLVVMATGCIVPAQLQSSTPTAAVPAATDTLSDTPTPPATPIFTGDTPAPTPAPTTTTILTPPPLATNGPYLAYRRQEGDQAAIILLDADGHGQKRIAYPPNAAQGNMGGTLNNVLSPDGKWLAYYSGSAGECFGNGTPDTADLRLNLLSMADGKTQVVTSLLSNDYPNNFAKAAQELGQADISAEMLQNTFVCAIMQAVAWSPDGRSLAFAGQMDGLSSDLYLYDTADGSIKRLSSGPQEVQWISWSPDGKWILDGSSYSVGEGMKYSIYATSPDGSTVKLVSQNTPAVIGASSWLNNHAFFDTKGDNGPGAYDLKLVDVDSGKTVEIWNGSYGPFAFIPNGNWVALYANTPVWPYPYTSDFVRGPFLVNLTTLQQTRVNFPSSPDSTFVNVQAFNSSGDKMFILKTFGTTQSLYYLSADGTLTPTGVQADTYSVSPDRQYWAAAGAKLQVFSADGSLLRSSDLPANLTGQGIGTILWRPDDSGLFFTYQDPKDYNSPERFFAVDLSKGDLEQVDEIPPGGSPDFVWIGTAK